MRPEPDLLLNTPDIELWPARLLRPRDSREARILARARRVLRRKRDGRHLAAELAEGMTGLMPGWHREAGLAQALAALEPAPRRGSGAGRVPTLPMHRLRDRLARLDIDPVAYATRTGLDLVAEPVRLRFAGLDRFRRPLWLHEAAARAWPRMRDAARRDGVELEAISGYRSHDYQLGIFERKRARGQHLTEILRVNAAPGYSEHHSGLALDLGTPGEPAAEESFERSAAFAWLRAHAAGHGFAMSYPRDNPHGIVYEPWHWRLQLP